MTALQNILSVYRMEAQYQPKAGIVPAPSRAKNDHSGDTTCHD